MHCKRRISHQVVAEEAVNGDALAGFLTGTQHLRMLTGNMWGHRTKEKSQNRRNATLLGTVYCQMVLNRGPSKWVVVLRVAPSTLPNSGFVPSKKCEQILNKKCPGVEY